MHYTREPIIETVITPREGFKLVIRNSKATGVEEYLVDAVEIISFGSALFYRSMERPKQFLLPVSDYEVVEVRETRMVLKHVAEKPKEEALEQPKKRRTRRRRTKSEEAAAKNEEEAPKEESVAAPVPVKEEPRQPPPSREAPAPRPIIPPPTSLISENIDRYKEMVVQKEEVVTPPADQSADKPQFSASRFLRRLTGREEE